MQGYYRYPALFQDQIVFVSEDDLWLVSSAGGIARRLTTGLGTVSRPVFSPDGKYIAFAGSDEGPTEIYVMPSEGGPAQRLTFLGDMVAVVEWREDGIYFTSPAVQCQRLNALWRISPTGGIPEEIHWGPLNFVHHVDNHSQKCVIQRLGYREYGYWKRYRGGTAGEIWIDRAGQGNFEKLISLKADFARPLWIGDRIYFSADYEGIGNIYSCTPEGNDLQRCTHHEDFYVRNQSTDGNRIVYHAGGDLYLLDPRQGESQKVDIVYNSPRTHRNRKFIKATKHLQSLALHPNGHYLSSVHRGKIFAYGNHEGPVTQLGVEGAHRYRLSRWLSDGKRIVAICDYEGEESLVIYNVETGEELVHSKVLDIGRAIDIKASPVDDAVLLVNHRMELIHLDLVNWTLKVIDKGSYQQIDGFNWSPDGKWVVYSKDKSIHVSTLKLYEIATGAVHEITRPVLHDGQPVFDPEGKYIYFLSQRDFTPTMDSLHFNYSFMSGMRVFLLTLQKDTASPFLPQPKPLGDKVEEEEKTEEEDKEGKKDKKVKDIQIDIEGIQDRIIAFPIEAGHFSHLVALKGKIGYIAWPLISHEDDHQEDSDAATGTLEIFDFESLKTDHVLHGISHMILSHDAQTMALMYGKRVRVIKAGEKPDDSSEPRKSGWIDLTRIRPFVNPVLEWMQIFREAWRLQRDQFWAADMSQIDWQIVYDRYFPLVERISTRRELSDLIWEMQGELGTSHAYAWGGDLPFPPYWSVGQLAAEYEACQNANAFRIKKIIKGDIWDARRSSPLAQPGINLEPGNLIWGVNGRAIDPQQPLEALLVNQAQQEIRLTVSEHEKADKRTIVVKTLASQGAVRYREWVESNRAYVHDKTSGKVGYVHIPDMSRQGFSEFHRGFLAECDREGLVVDVRFNGGGNVSWLLLEKLARKRLGYDYSRWNGILPYPADSGTGRMVALTNEHAGSDGDIFSHVFKTMKLGPLIGKRTWGGVIGIWPRHSLVDEGMTSQPEFSCWFEDNGWAIENYGVDPDIEVEITPQDYSKGIDTQLDRGIEEVLAILRQNPIKQPSFADRPNLALPKKLLK